MAFNACPQASLRARQCACCIVAVSEAFWGCLYAQPFGGSHDELAYYQGRVKALRIVLHGLGGLCGRCATERLRSEGL